MKSPKEAIIVEVVLACVCFVFGGLLLNNACRTFFENKGSLLPDCLEFSWFETIVGIAFVIVGGVLMWEAQRDRFHPD